MAEEQAFEVRDRRLNLGQEAGSPASSASTASTPSTPFDTPPGTPLQEPPPSTDSSLPVNFSSFVLSLATSALVHLGVDVRPETGTRSVNLPLARQTIDLIGLLQEKTKGNLTKEEEDLFSQILYTVRVQYLDAEKTRAIH